MGHGLVRVVSVTETPWWENPRFLIVTWSWGAQHRARPHHRGPVSCATDLSPLSGYAWALHSSLSPACFERGSACVSVTYTCLNILFIF